MSSDKKGFVRSLLSRRRRTHQQNAAPASASGPNTFRPPSMSLHDAILTRNETVAAQIIHATPPPSQKTLISACGITGLTPLGLAVTGRHHEIVRLLLSVGAFHSTCLNKGRNLLCLATSNQDLLTVRHLLKAGANPNERDDNGDLALHYAVRTTVTNPNDPRGHSRAIVVALLGFGANVDAPSRNPLARDATPLKLAITSGSSEMVSCLLEQGARLDVPDKDGCFPIHHAALRSEVSSGLAAYAATIGHASLTSNVQAALDRDKESVLRILLKHGADVNQGTVSQDENRDSTPLHYAALEGSLDLMRVLVNWKVAADVHRVDAMGESVIYWAAANSTPEGVKLLKFLVNEKRYDPNIRHNFGGTPLHIAAYRGIEQNVTFLLREGTDKEAFATNHHFMKLLDIKGTAEDFARKEQHWMVANTIAMWDDE